MVSILVMENDVGKTLPATLLFFLGKYTIPFDFMLENTFLPKPEFGQGFHMKFCTSNTILGMKAYKNGRRVYLQWCFISHE